MSYLLTRFRRAALLLALLSGSVLTALAQPTIPTAGFETWRSQTIQTITGPQTIQLPQAWDLGLFSSFTVAFGMPYRADRSTIAHTGTASAHFTVGADSIGADMLTRFPVTSSALGMEAWVRSSGVVADTQAGFVVTIFTRSLPGGGVDTVAAGGGPLNTFTANQWERKLFPVVNIIPANPDSVTVWILNFGSPPGHELWVDDLRFTNSFPTGTPAEQSLATPLTISPNPASTTTADGATLTVTTHTPGPAVLTITDVLGRTNGRVRVIKLTDGENRLALPVRDLPAGTYWVQLTSADGNRRTRLVIE